MESPPENFYPVVVGPGLSVPPIYLGPPREGVAERSTFREESEDELGWLDVGREPVSAAPGTISYLDILRFGWSDVLDRARVVVLGPPFGARWHSHLPVPCVDDEGLSVDREAWTPLWDDPDLVRWQKEKDGRVLVLLPEPDARPQHARRGWPRDEGARLLSQVTNDWLSVDALARAGSYDDGAGTVFDRVEEELRPISSGMALRSSDGRAGHDTGALVVRPQGRPEGHGLLGVVGDGARPIAALCVTSFVATQEQADVARRVARAFHEVKPRGWREFRRRTLARRGDANAIENARAPRLSDWSVRPIEDCDSFELVVGETPIVELPRRLGRFLQECLRRATDDRVESVRISELFEATGRRLRDQTVRNLKSDLSKMWRMIEEAPQWNFESPRRLIRKDGDDLLIGEEPASSASD